MCQPTDHVLLSETEKARISKCRCCGQYVLIYNNLYIPFNKDQLVSFTKTLRDLESSDFNKVHPNGQQHVLLRNCKSHLGVSLSRPEADEVLEAIREASLFEEVFSILYTK